MLEKRKGRYSGQLSPGAKKRLARACTLLVQTSKKTWLHNEVTKKMHLHQLSFITLTISDPDQKLSGKEAYSKLLCHFLQWLRRTKCVTTYLWKAELQQNGQIHYHITTPSFINYQEIRDKWNNLQRRVGLLEKYHSNKGHYNANSTDVHEVRNVNDAAAYLLKYISKETQNIEKLGGKVWDCSENLKKNGYFSTEMNATHEAVLNEAVAAGEAIKVETENFYMWKFKKPVTERVLSAKELEQYKVFLDNVRCNQKYIPPGKVREKYLPFEQTAPPAKEVVKLLLLFSPQ